MCEGRTAQLGTLERSGVCAETTTSEIAEAAMVEKRILIDVVLISRVKRGYSFVD
jgi:hypothetical protein